MEGYDYGAATDAAGSESLVISCEHGSKRIPPPYAELVPGDAALLESHRAWDPGALMVARELAAAFSAPLVAATVSRLLVDLNRSPGHPRLHCATIARAPAEVRQQLVQCYYQSYRAEVERRLRQAILARGRVLHVSCHSFTPVLDGQVRHADLGLLYDPARPGEVALCQRWKTALNARAPDLAVRRNYPYAGTDDGLTRWLRQRLAPHAYLGIELEVNQKHVGGAPRRWTALRALIVDSLRRALVRGDTDNARALPGQ